MREMYDQPHPGGATRRIYPTAGDSRLDPTLILLHPPGPHPFQSDDLPLVVQPQRPSSSLDHSRHHLLLHPAVRLGVQGPEDMLDGIRGLVEELGESGGFLLGDRVGEFCEVVC